LRTGSRPCSFGACRPPHGRFRALITARAGVSAAMPRVHGGRRFVGFLVPPLARGNRCSLRPGDSRRSRWSDSTGRRWPIGAKGRERGAPRRLHAWRFAAHGLGDPTPALRSGSRETARA
jgi:hypothetical protein